jgi:hypothetical protein
VVQMLDSGDSVEVLDCDPDSIVEGELEKRASSMFAMTRWYARWFVLKKDSLLYRTVRRNSSAKMLDLCGVRECKREGQKGIRIKHSFRILYLRAASSFERDAWLDAIDSTLLALKNMRHAGVENGPARPSTAWTAPANSQVGAYGGWRCLLTTLNGTKCLV